MSKTIKYSRNACDFKQANEELRLFRDKYPLYFWERVEQFLDVPAVKAALTKGSDLNLEILIEFNR
tara:strand:- start:302 stop:499 length:198 start_codon:yes stop_codon:yes gene_type:complete